MSSDLQQFDLQDFTPYRLAVLADAVCQTIAQVHADRFGLSQYEWRVMAALKDQSHLPAKTIVGRTTMDKMQVSRAVTQLEKNGLITRREDKSDRRNKVLCLSRKGETMVERIIPLVLAREAFLMSGISQKDLDVYARVLNHISENADSLLSRG